MNWFAFINSRVNKSPVVKLYYELGNDAGWNTTHEQSKLVVYFDFAPLLSRWRWQWHVYHDGGMSIPPVTLPQTPQLDATRLGALNQFCTYDLPAQIIPIGRVSCMHTELVGCSNNETIWATDRLSDTCESFETDGCWLCLNDVVDTDICLG